MSEAGKVLVVEDDSHVRRLINEVLSARGYSVRAVDDGRMAVPAALAMRPDLALLDVGLPGLDGLGVLAQLKDDCELARTSVVMMTAWADPELIVKALDRGAYDCLRKPFDVEELSARVDAAVRAKTLRDLLSDDNPQLRAVASSDALTALANRRALSEQLDREIALARRGREFSVLLIDLDDFGGVNATYGSEVGDALLYAVARRIAARVRVSDVIGRLRDDEFLVVTPATDAAGACVLAEDLRALIAVRPLDTAVAAVRISASIGVAQGVGESAEALLARCHDALAVAKHSGGDAVRLA
jgi:two-component system, cell cycle response regulator